MWYVGIIHGASYDQCRCGHFGKLITSTSPVGCLLASRVPKQATSLSNDQMEWPYDNILPNRHINGHDPRCALHYLSVQHMRRGDHSGWGLALSWKKRFLISETIGCLTAGKQFSTLHVGNLSIQYNRKNLLEIFREISLTPYLGNIIIW